MSENDPVDDPWAKRPAPEPPPADPYAAPDGPPGYGPPSHGAGQYGAGQYGPPPYGTPQYGAPHYGGQQYGGPGFGVPPARPTEGLPVGPNGLVVPQSLPLAGRGRRLGGYLLTIVLAVVTLGIGYLIWDLILWGRGKSPAKQILGMTVVDAQTGRPATWGHMCVRQFLVAGLLFGIINVVIERLIGVELPVFTVIAALFIFSDGNRTLWDRMAKTYVVRDNP